MKEIWKPVIRKGVSYKGIYEVSNTGKLRSLDRVIVNSNGISKNHKGRELVQSIGGNNYLMVNLSHKNKTQPCTVHELVMETFGRRLNKGECVDHTKGRFNNNFDTLRILTNRKNSSIEKTNKRDLPLGVYRSKNGMPFYIQTYVPSVKKTIGLGSYLGSNDASKAHSIALSKIESNNMVSVNEIDIAVNKYRAMIWLKPLKKRKTC